MSDTSSRIQNLINKINETNAKASLEKRTKQEVDHLSQQVEDSLAKTEQKTRSNLSNVFIAGLFALIIASAIYVPYYNEQAIKWAVMAKENNIEISPDDLKMLSFKDVFSMIFNSFGTPLGFIIGYYFKEKTKN
ncbi:hypothetical protein ACJO11_19610 [Vibrio parahaemolyticus]|uniref:hypothetical protein n=1 Tax=Vibrio parahaemolyticus TaxID=670 RepID=UPI001120E1E6|nr:hypothetical protein [Vibrio parahaemolyticus]MBE4743441.1 hypothetical protein [Vibrio parahaemolyticus]MCZ5940096.1 hypothetical protein [Vibrio parahaemolyticus]TOF26553.1 hypothetical protein CGJ27_07600 [Vibrio parahaemolyticus]HAS6767099.1 hypothetical protein [Vibrio parahaemolyticus]HBC3959069.1 hypothetical protein [Vibrio parahaemolyticus]